MRKLVFLLLYICSHIRYKLIYQEKAVEFLLPKLMYPIIYLKFLKVSVGDSSIIYPGLTLYNFKRENLEIGDQVHIGQDCFLDLSEKIIIKDRVTISMKTVILTHINLGASTLQRKYPIECSRIIVGADSYIGACCTILNSVKLIEKETLLAAHSLLKSDTESHSLFAGAPAVQIKKFPS